MSNILFAPLNTNHVKIFHAIVPWLKRPYEFLCHDRISESNQYRTEELLQKLALPYRHLPGAVNRSQQDHLLLQIANFFRIRRELARAVERIRPAAIVLAIDNDPISQILLRESKRRGVPTVLIQEALIRPHEYVMRKTHLSDALYKFLHAFGILLKYTMYGSGGCDRVLVAGRIAAGILERRGVPKSRIQIVGYPKYDALLKRIGCFPTPPDSRTYLYAASTQVVRNQANVRFLERLRRATANRGLTLLVKLHPRSPLEPSDLYRLLHIEPGPTFRVLKEGDDTRDILEHSYALVTVSSTVVLDALIMDRECIVANYLAGESKMEYGQYDAVYSVDSEEDLEEVIAESYRNKKPFENKKKLLEDELHLLDGNAGQRAAKAILSILNEGV